MENKQIVSLLARNHPGVLLRIIGLFTRRGFNIDNITAGVTQDKRYSRVTIVVEGDSRSERPAICRAALTYHATVVDVGQHTMTLQATATPNELNELVRDLYSQGILELARTGMTALEAGDGILSLDQPDSSEDILS